MAIGWPSWEPQHSWENQLPQVVTEHEAGFLSAVPKPYEKGHFLVTLGL